MASPGLRLGSGEFAQGAIRYIDTYPGDFYSRIVVPARFGDAVLTWAIVDTGAPWCILSPEESRALDTVYRTRHAEIIGLTIRGAVCKGWLYRMPIAIETDPELGGEGITEEATVFIPELEPNQEWLIPNFLGLGGFLERIRFAVDPESSLFYFGAL